MKRQALPFLLAPWLLACAATPAPAPTVQPPLAVVAPASAPQDTPAPAKEEPRYAPFSTETLELLLTAELAAYRQRTDITLHNYLSAAQTTRDLGVVTRATTIAQVLNRPESLTLSKLWTEIAPESAEAWYLLCLNSLRQLQFELAIPALDQLIHLQPEADLEQLFLAAIPASEETRNTLFQELSTLSKNHPENAHLHFGQALLLRQNQKFAEALVQVRQARQLRPSSSQALLLEAKLLTEQGRDNEAAQLLGKAIAQAPNNQNLRLNYARALIRANQNNLAQQTFQSLVADFPDNSAMSLSLALLAYDNHDDDIAQRELEKLRHDDNFRDEAHYYLGLLARRQQRAADAITAFESVPPGKHYLPAQTEIARQLLSEARLSEAQQRFAQVRTQYPELAVPLYQIEVEVLVEHERGPQAMALLDNALLEFPNNIDLLLSRAFTAERQNELEKFETDLRHILRLEPDNPTALNALGYTLANRTGRFSEAEAYIKRAHEIRPDDPAIIDSLGWVKFKLGDKSGALTDLRRAYALFPNDEVAAHLGEVLWALGEKEEARQVWADALRQHPNSKYIPPTRERLDLSQP